MNLCVHEIPGSMYSKKENNTNELLTFRVFEWKSHFNTDDTKSYSRLQCFSGDSICYKTEQSKCNDVEEKIEILPFGHCQEDMSMIISSESFTISCGDQVVEAKRCSDAGDTGPANFNITVEELKNGVCATRIRPKNSGWINFHSGERKGIDFKSHSLFINQLMIREKNLDTTLFTVNFHAATVDAPDDTAVMVITLESSGSETYINKTFVTLNATICRTSTISRKLYVGEELGKAQLQIILFGERIVIMVRDGSGGVIQVQEDDFWLPSCSEIEEKLMMSFEDATAKRNTHLMSNTNIKIVEKGECSDFISFGYKILGEDQTEYPLKIGSELRVGCENPMYEISGNDEIACLMDKKWSPFEFPLCVKKTCEALKYLDVDGSCKDCFEFAGRCEICDTTYAYGVYGPELEIYLGEDGICQKCKNFVMNDTAFLDTPKMYHNGGKTFKKDKTISFTCVVQGFPRPSATLAYENLVDGERSQIAGASRIENSSPTHTEFYFLIYSSCDYSQYKFTCETRTTNQTDCSVLHKSSSIEGPIVTGCQYAAASETEVFAAFGVAVFLFVMVLAAGIYILLKRRQRSNTTAKNVVYVNTTPENPGWTRRAF